MGIVTYERKAESPVPAARLFKMLILEADTYLAKIPLDFVKSVETREGDGGSGIFRQINFSEGFVLTHVEETLDKLDAENMILCYTIIGGDPALINNKIEKMSFELKFDASPNGGTIAKRKCKAYTVDGVDVNEEEVIAAIDWTMEVFFRAFYTFSDWAIANPDDA